MSLLQIDTFGHFLVEAIINGILFGGVLALLALGLNLVFGVVDVVWICYAELAMVGMYSIYWGNNHFGIPLMICVVIAILGPAAGAQPATARSGGT